MRRQMIGQRTWQKTGQDGRYDRGQGKTDDWTKQIGQRKGQGTERRIVQRTGTLHVRIYEKTGQMKEHKTR